MFGGAEGAIQTYQSLPGWLESFWLSLGSHLEPEELYSKIGWIFKSKANESYCLYNSMEAIQ